MDTNKIIKQILGDFIVSGKSYHSPLPAPVATWYCYLKDSGHNIVVVLKENFQAGTDLTEYLVPAPVKAVLRSYTITGGYVVADLPYDDQVGLKTLPDDDEF